MGSQYRSISKIAVGGMAEVLLGLQQGIEGFEKLVVIKRILPHLRDNEEFVRMFLAEARLAASLSHHNIVETLDIHRDQESFFIALEYISGEDLRYVIANRRRRNKRVPVPIACRIIADVAAALDHAHNARDVDGNPRRIVHRDVAPSNILVSYEGIGKLVDFGVAKANAANVSTRPGVLKGKFGYMAPEQVRQQPIDHRADIFSLGVVMHELLTGRRLFKASTSAAVITSLMEDEPAPPSIQNPDVPPMLDGFVLNALEKDPAARTTSSAIVREQMERVLAELGACSHNDVGIFMKSELGSRWERRKLVERDVLVAGRKITTSRPPGGDSSLPRAAFGTTAEATSADDGASSFMSAASVGHIGSAPLDSPHTGPHAPSVVAQTGLSQVADAHFTQSEVVERSRRGGALLVVLGAVGALLIMGAVLAGFLLGRTETSADRPVHLSTNKPLREVPVKARTTKPTNPQQQMATLIVHVFPGGGAVSLDGKQVGVATPKGLMVPIIPGKRVELFMQKAGYKPNKQVLEMTEGQAQHIHVNLQPVEAAVVAVNRATAAVPSATVPLVSTRKPLRRTRRRGQRKGPGPKRGPLAQTIPTGRLFVTFAPKNARLSVDGQVVSGGPPARLDKLKPGKHLIELSAQGFKSIRQSVEVVAGHAYALTLNLRSKRKAVAQLDLISAPAGAAITIDGKPHGRAPVLRVKLQPGKTYSVVATLSGYKAWTSRITPGSGANPPIIATLKKAPAPRAVKAESSERPKVAALTLPRSRVGSAHRGAGLFRTRCGTCHGRKGATVSPARYTQSQWKRYFAQGRHRVRAALAEHISRKQLADVKAYLISRAADVAETSAAGVR